MKFFKIAWFWRINIRCNQFEGTILVAESLTHTRSHSVSFVFDCRTQKNNSKPARGYAQQPCLFVMIGHYITIFFIYHYYCCYYYYYVWPVSCLRHWEYTFRQAVPSQEKPQGSIEGPYMLWLIESWSLETASISAKKDWSLNLYHSGCFRLFVAYFFAELRMEKLRERGERMIVRLAPEVLQLKLWFNVLLSRTNSTWFHLLQISSMLAFYLFLISIWVKSICHESCSICHIKCTRPVWAYFIPICLLSERLFG